MRAHDTEHIILCLFGVGDDDGVRSKADDLAVVVLHVLHFLRNRAERRLGESIAESVADAAAGICHLVVLREQIHAVLCLDGNLVLLFGYIVASVQRGGEQSPEERILGSVERSYQLLAAVLQNLIHLVLHGSLRDAEAVFPLFGHQMLQETVLNVADRVCAVFTDILKQTDRADLTDGSRVGLQLVLLENLIPQRKFAVLESCVFLLNQQGKRPLNFPEDGIIQTAGNRNRNT